MTQKQEKQVRSVSKFLRTVFGEDISICATILTLESEILEGVNINKNICTLIEALDTVRKGCSDMITKLKAIKED